VYIGRGEWKRLRERLEEAELRLVIGILVISCGQKLEVAGEKNDDHSLVREKSVGSRSYSLKSCLVDVKIQ